MAAIVAERLALPETMETTDQRPRVLLASENGATAEAYLLHDLKNNLQVVGSALNIVRRDVEQASSDQDRRVMAIAQDALDKARAAIITLTDRRVDGNSEVARDLDKLLKDLMPVIRVVMGADVQVDLDSAAPHMLDAGTAKQVENAVLNLALNAREAMPGGGRLEVTSRVVAGAHPGHRSAVCIAVRDTGTGMNPQALTRAGHNRFTTRPGRGGGLGLASIRDFARSVGGCLDIDSEKGVGTTVRLRLPL